MKQPTTEQFEVRQNPKVTSTNWPYFLLLGVAFFGVSSLFLKSESPILIFVVIAVVFGLIGQKDQARLTLHTDRYKMTMEVVKEGLETPISSTEFRWKELEVFQYISYTESNDTLYLKWQDGTTNNFSSGDTTAFRNYLRTYFPEREQEHGSIFST